MALFRFEASLLVYGSLQSPLRIPGSSTSPKRQKQLKIDCGEYRTRVGKMTLRFVGKVGGVCKSASETLYGTRCAIRSVMIAGSGYTEPIVLPHFFLCSTPLVADLGWR